jgi:predicted deacetylase
MKVNISIDDVSPHQFSSIKVLDRCFELIQEFPDIKFTLFVPISYWRTIKPTTTTKEPLRLDVFPDFCKAIRELPRQNFEICYHGLFHGIPGKSDNDEFQYLTKEQALEKFSMMFKIVESAGLQDVFKPIFRPPAWRMSPDAIEAAKEVGIRTLALSPKDYAKQTYRGAENNFQNVIYFNCAPPFDPLTRHCNNEIVYHACEWDKNYLSLKLKNELSFWLQQQSNVNFEFIENLV